MKKIISIILIMSALLSLASCKRKTDTELDALVDIEAPATEEIEEIKTETPKTESKTEEPKAETKTDTKKEEAPKPETKPEVTQKEEPKSEPETEEPKSEPVTEQTPKEETPQTQTPVKQPETTDNEVVTKEENTTQSETPVQTEQEKEDTSEEGTIIVSSTYPMFTVRQLMDESTLIVVCEYDGTDGQFVARGYNYTDLKMKISEVIYGDIKTDEIVVSILGGSASGDIMISNDEPDYEYGKKYMLFLREFKVDTSQTKVKERYRTMGQYNGVFVADDDMKSFKQYGSFYADSIVTKDFLNVYAKDAIIETDTFKEVVAQYYSADTKLAEPEENADINNNEQSQENIE